MLEELIKTGKTFEGCFTTSYSYGTIMGIDEKIQNKYLQWVARLGVYCEAKLKTKYPNMTNQIISMVSKQSVFEKDYNIIMGYLECAKELQNQ
ncbi:hypothetical protein G8S49_01425 [Clostridium botulinum C]|uniref:Uncharacterized protein n=2 Tax=Clostridium botulinum TaxID=1491 RepID=A0A9Q4XVM5_CLOBO|nr:hypothetical protein [Clostridium botulinum]EGO87979.1 hypothetical protein CBCST_08504 [Clostridium botulinum C str. Stockholm]MCD3194235.1 hypothetical protein [Clostridium botulinum C]MCD3199136.1 hypothetical protein [Clostridium botulinum C]MCD3204611.1 hypothetical protein [Clostridium botulinum C]MCD3207954.1 hypothetical protein [Clostridium botulinum C]